MRRDLGWKGRAAVLIAFAVIIVAAFFWSTSPRQYWAGDPNYDDLVQKDEAHQLFKVDK